MNLLGKSIEALNAKFQQTRDGLLEKWPSFTGVAAEKAQGAVLEADLWAERKLVPKLMKQWPNVPVLCEETENSNLSTLVDGIELLPYRDTVVNLPVTLMSVDGVDGSALYKNGLFNLVAMMAGLIRMGKPSSGAVMMLDDGLLYHTGINGKQGVFRNDVPYDSWRLPVRPLKDSLIGLDDNRAVAETFRKLVISNLMGSSGTGYPVNFPSGAGAIGVLKGNLAAYVTSNARHWDLAASAALCIAVGMIVRCLNGSEVPWNQVRMPAVVFARDEEAFEYVQKQSQGWLDLLIGEEA